MLTATQERLIRWLDCQPILSCHGEAMLEENRCPLPPLIVTLILFYQAHHVQDITIVGRDFMPLVRIPCVFQLFIEQIV